jgi:AcrR family transcriptional regulator
MRQQIISIATQLFMNQGYSATSTRQIAKILGITQPAIYHHFSNKEAIYIEVLSCFAIEVGAELKRILEDHDAPHFTLKRMGRYLKNQHPMNFSLMMRDMNTELSPEAIKELFAIWQANYFHPFIQFFHTIQSTLNPQIEVNIVARHFLRILSAYISDESYQKQVDDLAIDTMVDIFLYGVMTTPALVSE